MIADFGRPLSLPRRRPWRRSSRLVAVGCAAALAGSVVLGGNVYGALTSSAPAHVQVHSGDTLWGIASSHYPTGDVRERIDQIITLNHLPGSSISAGETLLLPAP